MYDTIRFWIDGMKVKDTQAFIPFLDNWDTIFDEKTGEVKYSYGNHKNIRVTQSSRGVSLEGSLAKYYQNHNLKDLSIKEIEEAITNLSDSLHLNLLRASVTRLDIGSNIELNNPIANYLELLDTCENFKKVKIMAESVNYIPATKRVNRLRELIFYDKAKECIDKSDPHSYLVVGANLMRYELKLMNKLPQQLKQSKIDGKTLFQESFYTSMISYWADWYSKISKTTNMQLVDMSNIKTVGQALESLLACMYAQHPTQVEHFQKALKDQKVFSDPKYYSRFKKKLKEIMTTSNLIESHVLINELDEKIKNISKSAL